MISEGDDPKFFDGFRSVLRPVQFSKCFRKRYQSRHEHEEQRNHLVLYYEMK
jgi:hypothetical protein